MDPTQDAPVFDSEPVLELVDVSFVRKRRPILQHLNWRILPGEKWALIGPNGSGKSTLLSIIAGLQWMTTGAVSVLGQRFGQCYLPDIQRQIYLFQPNWQEHLLQRDLSSLEIVCSGFTKTLGLFQNIPEPVLARGRLFLAEAGLEAIADQQFQLLSSGEKRRVVYLRSRFSDAQLYVLDEPFENLDLPSRERLLHVMEGQLNSAKPVILVTHRLDEIPPQISHIFLLKQGECLAQGKKQDIFTSELMSSLYDWPVRIEEQNGRFYAMTS